MTTHVISALTHPQDKRILLATLVAFDPHGTLRTPLAWECNCEEAYLCPATDDMCFNCGALRDESPSAAARDVVLFGEHSIPAVIRKIVAEVVEQVAPDLLALPF